MKKTLSILLSFVLLTASLTVSLSADAATRKKVTEYKVGDSFTVTLKAHPMSDTERGWTQQYYNAESWKKAYYAKFRPTADGLYEFAVKGEDYYGEAAYQALIVDSKDEVVSFSYAYGEDSYNIDLVGDLKKGETYYYLIRYFTAYDDITHTVKLKVNLKKHKHQMVDLTKSYADAEYLLDYAIDSEEPVWVCKIQGCGFDTKSIYYHRYLVDLSRKSYTYDGKEKKPKVLFYDIRGKQFVPEEKGVDDINLKVVYENNTSVGRAKVKIRTEGTWQTIKFNINPKGTALKKLTPYKKSIKVRWTKQPTKTSGYQIQYATNKSFKKAKKITVKGNKNTAKTIKKLKRHKRYYIRVRTYKTVDGKKYYSKWSKAKSLKTK